MSINIEIKAIQINHINNYRLTAFPEDRINILVSELNVHYDKINNYIESKIAGDQISIEVIDSLTKLNEIFRLAPPYRINNKQNSGDFRFGTELLESVIAILNTNAGKEPTRRKLLDLGWSILDKLYDYSINDLINASLLFRWLNKNNLIRSKPLAYRASYYPRWTNHGAQEIEVNKKFEFTPSDEEINDFYEKNKENIYKYMVFDMNDQKDEFDPLTYDDEQNFYHYYKSLENIKI